MYLVFFTITSLLSVPPSLSLSLTSYSFPLNSLSLQLSPGSRNTYSLPVASSICPSLLPRAQEETLASYPVSSLYSLGWLSCDCHVIVMWLSCNLVFYTCNNCFYSKGISDSMILILESPSSYSMHVKKNGAELNIKWLWTHLLITVFLPVNFISDCIITSHTSKHYD